MPAVTVVVTTAFDGSLEMAHLHFSLVVVV